jgi:ABC-type glycerol-3-phosphate transport system substrate-binding protein
MSARILASLLAAFAIGAAASSGPAVGAEPLQVWSYLRADTASKDVKERAVGDIVQAFKTANPGVDVVVTVMPWQQLSPSLLRASKSGQVPDVVMLFSPSVQMQIAAGTLVSLQPYIDKWPQDVKSDLVHLSQNVSPKGGTYAVPWQLRVSGLMYRDDLLKAAGKQPPRTLDELASLAQTLPKDGNVGLAMGFSPEAPSVAAGWFLTTVTGSGGTVLNGDGSAAFDSPQAERLAKWARDLVHSGKDAWPLNVALQGQEQAYSLFSAKRSVFFAMSSDRLDNVRLKTQLGKDIKMVSYPGWEKDKPSPALVQSWNFVIPKGSRNEDAAWKFIEISTSPELQTKLAKLAGFVPVRRSSLKDAWFKSPEAQNIDWAVDYAATYPLEFRFPENTETLYDVLANMFGQILTDKMAPREALKAAEAEYNRRTGH